MEISCLATGSTGNCYLVKLGSSCILLDAGIDIKRIYSKVNINDIDFCFISHKHRDHSKSLKNLRLRGVSIIKGNLIADFEEIAVKSKFGGKLRVFCFPIEHEEEKNSGIIIFDEVSKECLLYATDFNKCKYDVQKFLNYYCRDAKFTKVMVECNYLESIIKPISGKKETRQIDSHMGLNGTIKFLNMLDLTACQEILLVHISQKYGDSIVMGATIYGKYKIRTGVCQQDGGIDYYG